MCVFTCSCSVNRVSKKLVLSAIVRRDISILCIVWCVKHSSNQRTSIYYQENNSLFIEAFTIMLQCADNFVIEKYMYNENELITNSNCALFNYSYVLVCLKIFHYHPLNVYLRCNGITLVKHQFIYLYWFVNCLDL